MPSHGWTTQLKQFDAYPKTLEDFHVKTYGGAIISIVAAVIMVVLFVSELNFYLTVEERPEIFVDHGLMEMMRINIDITFPAMSCSYLSLDVMDVSGESHLDVVNNLYKKRLNANGLPIESEESGDILVPTSNMKELPDNYCGSCYGSETLEHPCCNTCTEVREAYVRKGWSFNMAENIEQCIRDGWVDSVKNEENEGCNIHGFVEVNKVGGNFHIAPGKSFQKSQMHIHDLKALHKLSFNLTHTIQRISFGTDYPGIHNPLDGLSKVSSELSSPMYQYFIKVVPTVYNGLHYRTSTNQYSVTMHQKNIDFENGEAGLPGVFFIYDLSPMLIQINEHRRSFMHFLTGVCAIIGGVFTVAGMVDATLYHGIKTIKRKIELGKQG